MHEYKYKKEQYYEELKSYVIDYNHEVLSDGFYEWKIKNWSQLLNDEFSDEFEIGGYKWKILLNPNGYDNKVDEDYISVYLKNIDVQKNSSTHIYANCLLAIRNYKDCSCFFINNDIKSNHYNKYNNSCNWDHFIKRECLYEKTENSNRSIIEDDEVVIDIYIRIYKYNKVQYIHELESLTINKNEYDLLHDNNYYEWQIEDWNNLENEKSSDEFLIGNSKWKLCLYSDNEDKNGFASFYLKNMDSDNTLSHVCAKCILVIRNYEDYSCFYSKESEIIYFNKYNKLYGWKHFIKNKDLFKNNDNTNNSLIKNNKTVVGAYIFIYKYEEEQYNEELKRLIKDEKYEIDKEGYFEWEINEWNKLLNDEFNKEFNIGNQKWKLSLNPNGFDDKADNDSVTIELKNINIENVISTHLCSKCILTIRNYNDLSTFCVKRDMDYDYFDQDNSKCEWKQFIKKSDLFKLNEISNKPIIENNIAIIGVYIRTYKYIKEQYVDKIKNLIEDDGYSVLKNDYYEWEIEKIDNLNNNIEYSPEFEAAGHQWKMLLYPNGSTEKNEDYLSIYLKNLDVINNETSSTSILSKCVFSIHNNDYSHTYLNKSINFNEYNSYRNLYGIEKFINKDNLLNINSNSENQKIIIGAYIRVYKNDEDDEKLNNNKGWKEVHMICKNGSTEQLEKLIRLGYHLSEKTKDGWYPLHIACQNGKIDIVKFLIENDQGIDINLRSNGETPIEIACSNNYYEIVDYLLDKEANLIYLNSEEEYKLLHIATINNNIKMVKLLLNKGKIQIH
ncbi:ankyrin, partial [Anaeromyces robustus]